MKVLGYAIVLLGALALGFATGGLKHEHPQITVSDTAKSVMKSFHNIRVPFW
jgi:hypothetical protein